MNIISLNSIGFSYRYLMHKCYLNIDGETHTVTLEKEKDTDPVYPSFICKDEDGKEIFKFGSLNMLSASNSGMIQIERFAKSDVTLLTVCPLRLEEDEEFFN